MTNKYQLQFICNYWGSKIFKKYQRQFLEVIFGKGFNDSTIIDKCVEWGIDDAIGSAGRYIGLNNTHKVMLRGPVKNIFLKNKYEFDRKQIDEVATLFSKLGIPLSNGSRNCSEYGLAQKIVNMFYKNMLVYSFALTTTKLSMEGTDFDCPLDSIILKEMEEKHIISMYHSPWSKMNKVEYEQIQKNVNAYLKTDSNCKGAFLKSIGNMAFDFLYFI